MLDGDPGSIVVDGFPDLSKYLFIHSSIDDAGLDPYEFRVFCHLRRRARQNAAYPGMRSISKVTRISVGKVCTAISSLQAKGFISVCKRPGNHRQNIYYIGAPVEKNSVHHMNSSVHHMNERVSREGSPICLKNKNSLNRTPLSGGVGGFNEEFCSEKKERGKDCTPDTMKKKTYGQLPLQSFEDAFEDAVTRTDRPSGMPPHNVIATEVKKLGLLETDADAIYDVWLSNGFTLKGGRKIRDFRAALRTWARNEWFPSQRKAAKFKPLDNKERMRAQMERMQANGRNRVR